MGGSGSGRRQRYQRRTTEGYLALDIAVLRRRGLLQPGRSGTISWSRGGERIGSASLFAESGSLRLSYQTTTSEGSAERSMSGLRFGRHRHRSVDNDDGSDVQDAIADAASCMAGLVSAAGSAMACRMSPNSRAVPSAPTDAPARSGGGLAAPTA